MSHGLNFFETCGLSDQINFLDDVFSQVPTEDRRRIAEQAKPFTDRYFHCLSTREKRYILDCFSQVPSDELPNLIENINKLTHQNVIPDIHKIAETLLNIPFLERDDVVNYTAKLVLIGQYSPSSVIAHTLNSIYSTNNCERRDLIELTLRFSSGNQTQFDIINRYNTLKAIAVDSRQDMASLAFEIFTYWPPAEQYITLLMSLASFRPALRPQDLEGLHRTLGAHFRTSDINTLLENFLRVEEQNRAQVMSYVKELADRPANAHDISDLIAAVSKIPTEQQSEAIPQMLSLCRAEDKKSSYIMLFDALASISNLEQRNSLIQQLKQSFTDSTPPDQRVLVCSTFLLVDSSFHPVLSDLINNHLQNVPTSTELKRILFRLEERTVRLTPLSIKQLSSHDLKRLKNKEFICPIDLEPIDPEVHDIAFLAYTSRQAESLIPINGLFFKPYNKEHILSWFFRSEGQVLHPETREDITSNPHGLERLTIYSLSSQQFSSEQAKPSQGNALRRTVRKFLRV